MSTHIYRAERLSLQRVGYEASWHPFAACHDCPHLTTRDGERDVCHEQKHFLQPCPVRRRERERAAAPKRETLEEVME